MAKMLTQEIVLTFVLKGVAGIEDMVRDAGRLPSKVTLRKALRTLHESGYDYRDLEEWAVQNVGAGLSGTHARRPVIGDTKRYAVNYGARDHHPFVRVPLMLYGLPPRGEDATVEVFFAPEGPCVMGLEALDAPAYRGPRDEKRGGPPAAERSPSDRG